jgi:hypothetical protein
MKHLGTNFLNQSCNHFLVTDIELSTDWGYLLSYERAFSSPVYRFRMHECLPSFLHGVVLMHRFSFIFIFFFNYLAGLNASYVQSLYNTVDLRSLTYFSGESVMVPLVAL